MGRHPLLLPALLLAGMLALPPLLPSAAHADQGGFMVSPSRLDVDVRPGSATQRVVSVQNTQNRTMRFVPSVVDFTGSASDPLASPVLLDGRVDSPISGSGWLSAPRSGFQLAPGQTRNLTVTIRAPAGATGARYAALVVTGQRQDVSPSLSVQSRVASLFLLNAGGVGPPELVFESVFVNEGGNTVIDYFNDGAVDATPDATMRFENPITGETIDERSGECSTALPGAMGRCVIEGEGPVGGGLLDQVYRGEVALSNGGREFTQAMPVQVAGGIKSLLLPLAGIGLFAGYFVFLRRRGSEDEDEELMLAD